MKNKIVTFGEIMLRLATPGYLRFSQCNELSATFGGGEANVAVSLANYGMETEFVTRLPENDIAEACIKDLHKQGVGTHHILRGGERMGIYFLETGAVSRGSKVIYDRAHSAIAEIEKGMIDWKEVLNGATWFHWTGITPAISQGAADVCLEAIKAANELHIPVSCDLNYRKNLWKYGKSAAEVMPEMVAGCDIILGNEEDAEKVFGIKPEGFDVTATGGAIDFEQVRERLHPTYATLPESKESNHHVARIHQCEPQHVGRRSVRRKATAPVKTLRHHPHCRPRWWRRFVHGWIDLRTSLLSAGRSARLGICRCCLLSETYDLWRL